MKINNKIKSKNKRKIYYFLNRKRRVKKKYKKRGKKANKNSKLLI